jgi:CRISPR-associated protein Cas5d
MKTFMVDVWGDLACFTRPETKVERFSYPVMTPSAARGVLDAVYAKPQEFCWRICRVEVLKPIQYIGLRRNEVKEKISTAAISKARAGGEPPLVIADGTPDMLGTDAAGRTQRQTMALKDVRYRIHAVLKPRPGFEARSTGLEEQAERRLALGKCYYQPYLGCREFAAYFELGTCATSPIALNEDIGWMVYDVFDLGAVVVDYAPAYVSLFKARLTEGVLDVPDWSSDLVKKPNGR